MTFLNRTSEGLILVSFGFKIMEHKRTHLVRFIRRRKHRRFYVADVNDDSYFSKVVKVAFNGRFKKPESLNVKDGVFIIISRISDGMVVLKRNVYNKSILQVMNELETTITNTPV